MKYTWQCYIYIYNKYIVSLRQAGQEIRLRELYVSARAGALPQN